MTTFWHSRSNFISSEIIGQQSDAMLRIISRYTEIVRAHGTAVEVLLEPLRGEYMTYFDHYLKCYFILIEVV